jgi:hypothetical protein
MRRYGREYAYGHKERTGFVIWDKAVRRQLTHNGCEANGMDSTVSTHLALSEPGVKRFGNRCG